MGKKLLTLDIGASRVALAEYEQSGRDSLTLVNYGIAKLAAPLDAGSADTILSPALGEIMREKGIKPGPVAVSVSGQMVFPRFAAIPMAGGQDKFEQMVRYEIEQNIPFPIDEMVCDRQVLGDTPDGDKSVMIVAAKIDQIEAITGALTGMGFTPELVDVAPIAVTNAVRYVAGDDGNCSIILDIGAKTTSLIIAEGDRLYNRTIPIGGNNINRDIGQALGIGPEDAELKKLEKGYVSQGGVVEDEDAEADRISKVCRAVLTRLHAEISRSVNFYRSQQGGSAPVRMYLTGGTALLPQVDEFFSENLGIEVVFFNPFDRIGVGGGVDAGQLGTDAAMLAASAGVAVHQIRAARFDINLIPPAILEARAEKAKLPLVAAGGAMLVAALVCVLLGAWERQDAATEQLEKVEAQVNRFKGFETKIKAGQKAVEEAEADARKLRRLLYERERAVLCLRAVAEAVRPIPGMWIEKWEPGKEPGKTLVTIRGWKDQMNELVKADAGENEGKERTTSEIVVSKIKTNAKILLADENIRISDMTAIGKDGNVEQFTVEVQFK